VAPLVPLVPVAPVAPVGPVAPVAPARPVAPVEPVAPVGPVGPVSPIVTSNVPVEGVPVVVVTERRYEAAGITGSVATMLVDELLMTVSGTALSLTVGTVLPKFFPVMVIWFVTRLAVALLMTTWFDAACTRAGAPASVRATTAKTSMILECDLSV